MPADIRFDTMKFDKFVARFPREIERTEGPRFLRRIGLSALSRIAKRTPVDTGRARAGWQMDDSQAESKLFVEVINRVPYIVFLEYGRSKQAPSGMVRISLHEMEASGYIEREAARAIKQAARDAGAI